MGTLRVSLTTGDMVDWSHTKILWEAEHAVVDSYGGGGVLCVQREDLDRCVSCLSTKCMKTFGPCGDFVFLLLLQQMREDIDELEKLRDEYMHKNNQQVCILFLGGGGGGGERGWMGGGRGRWMGGEEGR